MSICIDLLHAVGVSYKAANEGKKGIGEWFVLYICTFNTKQSLGFGGWGCDGFCCGFFFFFETAFIKYNSFINVIGLWKEKG